MITACILGVMFISLVLYGGAKCLFSNDPHWIAIAGRTPK